MKHSKQLLTGISLALLCLGASHTIAAQNANPSFQVKATVTPACTINNAEGTMMNINPIDFGSYNPASNADIFVYTEFSIRCSVGAAANIALNKSNKPCPTRTTG